MELSLNFAGKNLTKLPIVDQKSAESVVALNVSENNLQRIEFQHAFPKLIQIDASKNEIARVTSLLQFRSVENLNISSNRLRGLDGLNELRHLKRLNASENSIEKIPLLDKLSNLVELRLAGNQILNLPNLSCCPNLQILDVERNKIRSLEKIKNYLPTSLKIFLFASNALADLAEAAYLTFLESLEQFTIQENPCVNMTGLKIGFNYRPYLICWCPSLKKIDGFVASETESLKGEELYIQGKGRFYLPGQHNDLVLYLSQCCPLTHDHLKTEEEAKLVKILAKRKEMLAEGASPDWRPISAPLFASTPLFASAHQFSTLSPISKFSGGGGTGAGSSADSDKENKEKHLGENETKNPHDAYENRVVAAARTTSPSPGRLIAWWEAEGSKTFKPTRRILTKRRPKSALSFSGRRKWPEAKPPPQFKIDEISDSPRPCSEPAARCSSGRSLRGHSSGQLLGRNPAECGIPEIDSDRGISQVDCDPRRQRAATKIQAIWRGFRCRHSPQVLQIYHQIRNQRLEETVRFMAEQLEKFQDDLEEQKRINNITCALFKKSCADLKIAYERDLSENSSLLMKMSAEMETLKQTIGLMGSRFLPNVIDVSFDWKSADSGIVRWELPNWNFERFLLPVESFEIFVDGTLCGAVRGMKRRAMVTDLDPTVRHRITVRVCGPSKLHSDESKVLEIDALHAENDENVPEICADDAKAKEMAVRSSIESANDILNSNDFQCRSLSNSPVQTANSCASTSPDRGSTDLHRKKNLSTSLPSSPKSDSCGNRKPLRRKLGANLHGANT